MNIAAYCRVSTDKSDQINSLEAQKAFFTDYAAKYGHDLVRIYADEGISGTRIKKRMEFQKLMKDAERGLFEMVVVKDISRFARNTVDLLQSTRTLKLLGIETTFLTANMTVLGNSEFVLTIFGALAQEESANTSKRIKFGKKLNAEKGKVPNIVYGYDKIPGDYFNLSINKEEAKTVQQIYRWYVNEGYGSSQIAEALNGQGIKTKRNCLWSQTAVCRILTNEIYCGKIVNGKQEIADFLTGTRTKKDESEWMVAERSDLKIIEPEMMKKAQAIMSERGRQFKVDKIRHSNKHLFSTLIKCKECGWSFTRSERTYKNTYIYWTCSGHNNAKPEKCSNRTKISEDELIRELDAYFAEIVGDKDKVIKSVVREFEKVYRARNDNEDYENELRKKLEATKKYRQKYMDMFADDLISREELNDKIGSKRKEIERLENDLKMVEYNLDKGRQLETIMKKTFSTMEDVVSVRQMSNAGLKQIIQKIEVDKDGKIDIYLRLLGDLGLDENVLISNDCT